MNTKLDLDSWWHNLNDEEFQSTFRMNRRTIISLQAEIDNIENQVNEDINRNLLASVWVLGNTEPFEEAKKLFGIKENIYKVLELYFHKILKLAPSYIVWPTENECKSIEDGFASQFGFPGVVGVIGSLYISVNADNCPNKEIYFNPQMGNHSVVLQIVCDNNLLLRDVCAGCPGGKSIVSILRCSPLFHILTDPNGYLMKNNKHILGGTEHPLLQTLLTPYKLTNGNQLVKDQYNFNLLHNSVMGTIERALTYLENRFPRLTAVEDLSPQFSTLVISAACVLYNFTRIRHDNCNLYV